MCAESDKKSGSCTPFSSHPASLLSTSHFISLIETTARVQTFYCTSFRYTDLFLISPSLLLSCETSPATPSSPTNRGIKTPCWFKLRCPPAEHSARIWARLRHAVHRVSDCAKTFFLLINHVYVIFMRWSLFLVKNTDPTQIIQIIDCFFMSFLCIYKQLPQALGSDIITECSKVI